MQLPETPLLEIDSEPITLFPASNYLVREREKSILMDEDAFDPYRSSPERFLLAALLERAKNDLAPWAKPSDREDALEWFESPSYSAEHFTFSQVKDELELSVWQVDFITKMIARAKEYEGRINYMPRKDLQAEMPFEYQYFRLRGRRA